MVRAKFKVNSVKNYEHGAAEVMMEPISSGSEENKHFWKYTPSGTLSMWIDNPDAVKQFVPGQEYYLDFILA